MLAKIFIILGVLLSGGAAFLGFQNRTELTNLRNEDRGLQTSIEGIRSSSDETAKAIIALNSSIGTTDGTLGESIAMAEDLTNHINRTKASITATNAEIAEQQTQVDNYKAELAKLPPGMSIDTLQEDIGRIKKEIGDLQTEGEKLKEESAAEKAKSSDLQKRLAEVNGRLEARKRLFSQNSLSGSVTSVNADWGFVVVNVGSSRGVAPGSDLLISRNGGVIAKVRPVDISSNRTVGTIIQDATTNPGSVQVGDRVNLEKTRTP